MKMTSSKQSNNINNNEHDKIWNLLPWFVNNTLNGFEKKQVEHHLASCTLCKQEVHQQRQLQQDLISDDTLSKSTTSAFNNVMQRIEQHEVKSKNVVPFKLVSKQFNKYNRKPIISSIAASFLALVIIGLFFTSSNNEKIYSTLSDTPAQNSSLNTDNNSAYLTRVIFNKNTSEHKINQLFEQFQGTLTSGPDKRGIYTIDFSKAVSSTAHYNALLLKLKHRPEILLVSKITKATE